MAGLGQAFDLTTGSVPIISRSARKKRILYSAGHGRCGLSLAAASAEIMLELLRGNQQAGQPVAIDCVLRSWVCHLSFQARARFHQERRHQQDQSHGGHKPCGNVEPHPTSGRGKRVNSCISGRLSSNISGSRVAEPAGLSAAGADDMWPAARRPKNVLPKNGSVRARLK